MLVQLGKFWTTRYKKKKERKKKTHAKKPAATFEVLGTKEGYRTQPLHTHYLRVGQPSKPALCPQLLTHPYPHPIKEASLAPLGEQAREPVTCFHTLLWSQKPGLNFLAGLLSISTDWGRPRILTGINFSNYHCL